MTMKPKNDFLYDTQLADLGTRLVALFVDGIILSVITGIIFNTSGDGAWLITFVMTLAYNWFFWTQWQGQTPGKRMVGIRIVKTDGSRITGTDALIRATGYYVNTMFLSIGWLWALFDEQKRGWHDMFAGTVVIKD
jgi:uncharacterized RDD family membrane protein YckC